MLPAADQLISGARGADRRHGGRGDDPRDPERVRPGGRVAGDQPVGQISQVVGHSRTGRQRGGVPDLLVPHHSPRIPVERPGPGQRLVHHDADRIPVGGWPGRLSGGLLRCHVGRRPGDPPSRRQGSGPTKLGDEPEVQDHHPTADGHHHVPRLQVPVHHVTGVQGHHPPGHLGQGVPEPALIHPSASPDVRQEVAPVQQVEGDEPLGPVALERPQPDQVRVSDVGQGAKLPLEPVERVAVDGGEHLQGDPVAPCDVNRLEDHAHPPTPQLAHEAVVAQAVRGQRPGSTPCPAVLCHREASRTKSTTPGRPAGPGRRTEAGARCIPRPADIRPRSDAAGSHTGASCGARSPSRRRPPARGTTGCSGAGTAAIRR